MSAAAIPARLVADLDPVTRPAPDASAAGSHQAIVARQAAIPAGGVAAWRRGAGPAGSSADGQLVAAAGRTTPVAASGWRNATATPGAGANGELARLGVPPTQEHGLASPAASPAGAAATALLALLAVLIFTSHGIGTLVRLRPAWAPAAPFLALSERPG